MRAPHEGDTPFPRKATFAKWYIRTMNIFGRSGSPKNALYPKNGLKLRDNDEGWQTFAAEVKENPNPARART